MLAFSKVQKLHPLKISASYTILAILILIYNIYHLNTWSLILCCKCFEKLPQLGHRIAGSARNDMTPVIRPCMVQACSRYRLHIRINLHIINWQ